MMNLTKRALAMMLALMLSLSALGALAASKTVEISKANFPDAKFRKYVKAEFDENNDGKLSAKEIKKVTEIYVWGKNISSLKGVEYFTELWLLNCSDNKLKELDVSKNTKLWWLTCSGNRLTSLKLGKNSALHNLACYDNPKLKSVDVGGCPAIKKTVVNQLVDVTSKQALYGFDQEVPIITDVKLKLTSGKKVLRKYAKPKAVAFTKKSVTLKKGSEGQLGHLDVYIKMTPATAVYPVKITTGDEKILELWNDAGFYGYAAAKKGTTTLNITSGGKKGRMTVAVK